MERQQTLDGAATNPGELYSQQRERRSTSYL